MIPETIGPSTEAINLVTHGTHQFAVWYTATGELRIGRILRGVQQWGVNHQEYEFAGTPRTVLSLPRDDDGHNIASIAVDGLGKIHVWANMHVSSMQAVVTTTPHTTNDWLATAGWVSAAADFPGVGGDVTYPFPCHLADGGLIFYCRDGPVPTGSGKSDSHIWRRTPTGTAWTGPTLLFQGLSVPDAKGPGVAGDDNSVDSEFNWNAYVSGPLLVESPRSPHPGRVHMCWVWRIEALLERPNVGMAYAYSDDNAATWKAVDGTSCSLPFTPINNLATRIPGHARITTIERNGGIVGANLDTVDHGIRPLDSIYVQVGTTAGGSTFNGQFTVATVIAEDVFWGQGGGNESTTFGWVTRDDYQNGQAIAIDDNGHPHIVASQEDTWWIRWDGSAWVQSVVPLPLNGVTHTGAASAVWLRGKPRLLKGSHVGVTGFRRPRLVDVAGGTSMVVMGGEISPFGGHEPSYDPEAYRRFGTVEVLTCDGDRPRVFTVGNGPRIKARAA